MKLRVLLAVLFGLVAVFFGLFALSFGAGTAKAVSGSDIYAVCKGWPGKTEVHWDKEWWLKNYGVKVVKVEMSWEITAGEWTYKEPLIEGETAKIITPLFAGQAQIVLRLSGDVQLSGKSSPQNLLVVRPLCKLFA